MGRNTLVIVVIVAVLATACSGDDGAEENTTTTVTTTAVPAEVTTTAAVESTTTAPPSTTTAAPTRTPIDTVVEFYAALNAEDRDRLLAVWPTVDPDLAALLTEGLHVRLSVTCRPDAADGDVVACTEEYVRHDFYAPAGVTGPIDVRMTTADGAVTDRAVTDLPVELADYTAAVGEWLATAYPDVSEAAYQGAGEYPFTTVEQLGAVLAVLPDFFAQSDVYPVGG